MKEENSLKKKIMDYYQSKGNLHKDGGLKGLGHTLEEKDQQAIMYTVEHENWNPYGGRRETGVSKFQGICIHNGKKEIEIKPMQMWKDGENSHKDNRHKYFSLQGLQKKREGIYEAVLSNEYGVEIHSIDFNHGESVLEETLKNSEYLERISFEYSIEEKGKIIRTKYNEILNNNNPRGCNALKYNYILNIPYKEVYKVASGPSFMNPDWCSEYYNALENPKGKIILFSTEEDLYGNTEHVGLIAANPASLELRELVHEKVRGFEMLEHPFIEENCLAIEKKESYEALKKWRWDLDGEEFYF